MAFPTGTIKLEAAQKIFPNQNIEPVKFDGKVIGYRATLNSEVFESVGLTELCCNLVSRLERPCRPAKNDPEIIHPCNVGRYPPTA